MRKIMACLVALVATTVANAAPLYGVSSTGPAVLYTINTTTGVATPVVTVTGASGASLSGLGSVNGTLYATDIYGGNGFQFGSINTTTGAFTTINNQGGSANWHGLAGNQAGQVLYSVDINNGNRLVSVTPAGAITLIGPGSGAIDGRGMAYDNTNGILYATGGTSLYRVNTATGLSTLIGNMGVDTGYAGLAFDDDTGTLYLTADLDYSGPLGTNLYRVNTSTGAVTLIGNTGVDLLDGLDFLTSQAVPEPVSLLVFGGLVAVGGLVARRRMKVAA